MKKILIALSVINLTSIFSFFMPIISNSEMKETKKIYGNVKNFINVKAFGIFPNINVDYSIKLKNALIVSNKEKKGLYFESGCYNFKINYITLKSYNSFLGESENAVIFNSINDNNEVLTIGNENYYEEVKAITIKNIIFNNINIKLSGTKKNDINIINNAFINTNYFEYQLSISHVSSQIIGNVFMRGISFKGRSLGTYAAKDTLIYNNFWGSFFDLKEAKNMLSDDVIKLIYKINNAKLKNKIQLTDDQGFFVTAYNITSSAKNIIFKNNYIHGNKYNNYFRDHLIYIKMYDNVKIIGNYFKGWPNSAQGGVKIRNTKNTIFCANYFSEDTQLATFIYDNVNNKDDMCLINTYIFNNYFNKSKSYFYMNFVQNENNKFANVKNYLVFNNIYTLSEKYKTQINGSWRIKDYSNFKEQNNVTKNKIDKVKSLYFTYVDETLENLINYLNKEDKALINEQIPLYS